MADGCARHAILKAQFREIGMGLAGKKPRGDLDTPTLERNQRGTRRCLALVGPVGRDRREEIRSCGASQRWEPPKPARDTGPPEGERTAPPMQDT